MAAGLFFAFCALVLVLRLRPSPELRVRPVAETLGGVALASIYAVPALLIVMAHKRRPVLLTSASAIGMLLIATSMSITPLLIVPAVLLFSTAPPRRDHPLAPAGVVIGVTVACTAAAFVVLLSWSTATCWTESIDASGHHSYHATPAGPTGTMGIELHGPTEVGGGCTDRAVTTEGALTSLALSALALLAAWNLARPVPD